VTSAPATPAARPAPPATPLEIWGGLECTVNRVEEAYFSQLDRNGHAHRDGDIERFAALGIRAIRYPVLWERHAPDEHADADWSWADARLATLRRHAIAPIVGLVHHGSGPRHTRLTSACFAPKLAQYARRVAERYPWVERWTPVNEPLTTARFAALYGVWYPHARDDASFVRALLNQCRAVGLAMAEIRQVNPAAQLVQTDDLGKSYGTAALADTVAFYNERRWLAWDLLCGRVDGSHPMWRYLRRHGATVAELRWFAEQPCPPGIVGVNHYVTGERWIDHRIGRYPAHHIGTIAGGRRIADIEAARALATPTPGIGPLLEEVWERYRLPIAVTEVHIDARREDQLRWLLEIWRGAESVRARGADVRAVTAWALLGSFDWNCLVRECRGYYEPGPFDVRSPEPRPTALAALVRELASGLAPTHPVLQGEGWWRRAGRFWCPPVASPSIVMPLHLHRHHVDPERMQPILVSGASGTLGQAFARICADRQLACRLVSRAEMDIAEPASVAAAIERHRPWAIVNASGYVHLDAAETDRERCFRENAIGPEVLAQASATHRLRLLTFSSDQVFDDGVRRTPWKEHDAPAPGNVYGLSKAAAERAVLAAHAAALVVRTSAFFGPWDRWNFVTLALDALAEGRAFPAAHDVQVSPTYVPDLVNVSLDLLIDGERGIWHLANSGETSWADFARSAAQACGVEASTLEACTHASLRLAAPRPAYAVLGTVRGRLMPSLEDALRRYAHATAERRAALERERARVAGTA
jgi:dTDP-4-dehydrorhamnose reductase